MRKFGKIDDNQKEIVKSLRSMGATVESLAPMGKGVPDLLVGYQGKTILMEVKDSKKPPSARALTEDQLKWHGAWNGGTLCVVSDIDSALRAISINKD